MLKCRLEKSLAVQLTAAPRWGVASLVAGPGWAAGLGEALVMALEVAAGLSLSGLEKGQGLAVGVGGKGFGDSGGGGWARMRARWRRGWAGSRR